jgi:hypothetical protein
MRTSSASRATIGGSAATLSEEADDLGVNVRSPVLAVRMAQV